MKYVYETDDEFILYDVYLNKNILLSLKENIIDDGLDNKIKYNELISIIEELIMDDYRGLDKLLELDLNVSFFEEEIQNLEAKISFNISIINEMKIGEREKICLENHLYLDKEQLNIYRKIDKYLISQYHDYLFNILSCVELKREKTKQKTRNI